MPSSTVTSKGQITIPVEVRTALGLHAGDRVQFVEAAGGVYELRPANRSVRALRGALARYAPANPVPVEAMGDLVASAAAEANR